MDTRQFVKIQNSVSDKTKFQDFWNEYKVLNQVLEDFTNNRHR